MSWAVVVVLAAAAYAMKAAGPLLVGARPLDARLTAVLELVAVPLLAALVLVQTLASGRHLVLDARAPALAVAALLVWRRAPLLVTVLAAAATAAALRTLTRA